MITRLLTAISILLIAAPAFATELSGSVLPPIRTIEVEGHGEVRTRPDTASLSVAIETTAPTAEQCARKNAELATKVSDALKAKLGDKGRIETGNYSLMPEYNDRPNVKPTIIGYRAENSIIAETAALDLIGPLIDAAIAAGANRVNSIDFTLRDDTKPRAEAIAAASKDAQAQAAALADSLGVKLKRIYQASTVAEMRPVALMRRERAFAASASAAAPTPIEPGQLTVPANVSLIYEIE
jgi:uncharacterized protein